jgi:hypothetical protein
VRDGAALVDPPAPAATPTGTVSPTPTDTPGPGGSLAPGRFFGSWPVGAGAEGDRLALADPRSSVRPAVQQVSEPASVFIDPALADLFLSGGPLVLAERVEGIPLGNGLLGFELDVTHNDDLLTINVLQHPFISTTGRTPYCLQARSEGRLRVTCFTVGTEPGPTGDGVLIGLIVDAVPGHRLRAAENNGLPVFLDNVGAHTRLAGSSPIPVGVVGDATVTLRALEGDVNGDCVVNVIDHQRMAGRYLLRAGSFQYDSFLDLEPAFAPDGDIDIRDLQVAYGRTGKSCAGSLQFADQDGDGCPDQDELGPNKGRGGQRNPLYPYDFFDTPPKDAAITMADVAAVVARFGGIAGPPPTLGYDPAFDRTRIGPRPWDLGPPDGVISIADVVSLVIQFGDTCVIPTFE